MFSTSLEIALLMKDWEERFGYLRCGESYPTSSYNFFWGGGGGG